jgi:hypothetical protein
VGEEFHDFCSSSNFIRTIKSRRVRWAGHVTLTGAMRRGYKISFGEPEGKRPLERTRRRWHDNIVMNLREIKWEGVECIYLAERYRGSCVHGDESSGFLRQRVF